jgi:hypothetical protein
MVHGTRSTAKGSRFKVQGSGQKTKGKEARKLEGMVLDAYRIENGL